MGTIQQVAPENAVRTIRKNLGISQEAMAAELKCSYNTLAKLEQQGRLPKNRAVLDNLRAMGARAGVQIGE